MDISKINYDTPFTFNNDSTGMTMLDFWKFQYSNIYDVQGYIAEFIVARALGITEPYNRDYWTLCDMVYRNMRIEVKQTSYYHPWNEGGKCSQQRSFGIRKANSSYENPNEENKFERQNDVYVFCLNTGETREEACPIELSNWEFYVVPTYIINKHCSDQKTISLNRIKKLGYEANTYDELKDAVDYVISDITQDT